MNLRRSVSLSGLTFATVSGILGSGWLFAPLFSARISGAYSLVAWVFGAAIISIVALILVEITALHVSANPFQTFTDITHGKELSYIVSWITWLTCIFVPAIEIQAIIDYASHYFPYLVLSSNSTRLSGLGLLVGGMILGLLYLINCREIKITTRINSILVMIKLLIPFIVCGTLIFHSANLVNLSSAEPLSSRPINAIFHSLTFGGIIYTYLGLRHPILLSAEALNPSRRNLLMAIFLGIGLCMSTYLFAQLTFLLIIPSEWIKNGWEQLGFNGSASPFATLIKISGAIWLFRFIYLDAGLSPFSTALINTATTARINFEMAANGLLPTYFLKLNQNAVPERALRINSILCFCFLFLFNDWERMAAFQATSMMSVYAIMPVALFSTLSCNPSGAMSKKILCVLGFYLCTLIILWTGYQNIMALMMAVIAITIFYILTGCFTLKRSLPILAWFISYLSITAFCIYILQPDMSINLWNYHENIFVFAFIYASYFLIIGSKLSKADLSSYFFLPESRLLS